MLLKRSFLEVWLCCSLVGTGRALSLSFDLGWAGVSGDGGAMGTPGAGTPHGRGVNRSLGCRQEHRISHDCRKKQQTLPAGSKLHQTGCVPRAGLVLTALPGNESRGAVQRRLKSKTSYS